MFRLSWKKFADGSLIKKTTKESWRYTERDGHSVDIVISYGRPPYILHLRPTWDSPAGELISQAQKDEIVRKFQKYFGTDAVQVE